jgi:hypothetical protein
MSEQVQMENPATCPLCRAVLITAPPPSIIHYFNYDPAMMDLLNGFIPNRFYRQQHPPASEDEPNEDSTDF